MKRLMVGIALLGIVSAQAHGQAAVPAAASLGARPPLEAFGKLPRIEQVTLSEDGAQIALVYTADDNRFLATYSLTDKVKKTVKLGNSKIRAISWEDQNHVLVQFSVTAKNLGKREEVFTATTVDIRTLKAKPFALTLDGRTLDFGEGEPPEGIPTQVTIGGKQRLYAIVDQTLCEVDPETGNAKSIEEETKTIWERKAKAYDWLFTRTGDMLARSTYDPYTSHANIEMRVNGAWKIAFSRDLSAAKHVVAPSIVGLAADGKSIVISDAVKDDIYANRIEPKFHYFKLTSEGVLTGPLEPENSLDYFPIFHPETGKLIGFKHKDDRDETEIFDPEIKALFNKAAKAVPDENILIASWSRDPKKMIVFSEGREDPGTYIYIDFNTGASQEIGELYPDVPAEWVAEQRPITYKAADGIEIHGYLTLPPGRTPKNLPLIVLPHGGPQLRDFQGFSWWAQALASRGYAVLQPNYRGSDGYGTGFVEKGHGEWGRKMQTDLSDGVRDLAKQEIIDPKRVCIVGGSYGGYAALAGAAVDIGPYRCAASVAGISDLHAMIRWEEDGAGPYSNLIRYWKAYYGPEPGWDAVSPYKQAAKVQIPVLLVHGRDDTVVPIKQSEMMRDALRSNGKTVEYVELKGEDHWLSTGETRLQMLKAVVAFVEKYNPADGEPVPEETPR